MTPRARLLSLVVIVTLLGPCLPVHADAVTSADPAEVRALIEQGAKVVDIRRADEWRETGVIDGSILLTAVDAHGRLVPGFPEALADALGRDDTVIVICRSGSRSAVITRMLSEGEGFTRLVDAGGGIRAWLGAGQPVSPCGSC